jgi:2-polyprenyl-3-methyl-5-hydroxy-6-metoxy-1,4-benzoquinol methylase
MILQESNRSNIVNDKIFQKLGEIAYATEDVRPVWVGDYFPTYLNEKDGMVQWSRIHYLYYLSFVEDFIDIKGKILDIGCGAGQFCNMLGRYANEVIGIDIDKKAIDFATEYNKRENNSFIQGDFILHDLPKFDYIFCIETIEHIETTLQTDFINKALSLLLENGKLFITTPIAKEGELGSGGHHGLFSKDVLNNFYNSFSDRIIFNGKLSNNEENFTDFDTNPRIGKFTHHRFVLK